MPVAMGRKNLFNSAFLSGNIMKP